MHRIRGQAGRIHQRPAEDSEAQATAAETGPRRANASRQVRILDQDIHIARSRC